MFSRLLLALAIAGGIAAWMWSGTIVVSGSAEEATPRPPAERSAANENLFEVRVETIRAEQRAQDLVMRARTRPYAVVSVAAETVGRLNERPVSRGSVVAAGDVLCKLDPGVREAELAKAQAEVAKAELEFDAASKLRGRGFESDTRVAATRAALDAAQAGVAAAEQEIERTIVRAPIGGVIQEPIAEVGSVIAMGGLCATLVDSDPLVVTGQVTERDVAKVRLGEVSEVSLITGETVSGPVTFVARTANPETRTFTVEVELQNPDEALRAGVTAEAKIPLPPVTAHRLSPGVLTLSDEGAIGVRTVDDEGIVAFQPVKIANQDVDGFWVTGLPDVVNVITVGQDYVTAGQKVAPQYVDDAGDKA